MADKLKAQARDVKKLSRRSVLKAALAAGGAAATTMGFPMVNRVQAQAATRWRVQTAWDAGTVGYNAFQKYCARIKELSEGKLEFQPFPAGAMFSQYCTWFW